MPNELLVIKRFHETTGDAPTAHTGLAFCSRCHPPWASECTLVGPGKDTHGTPVPTQWEGRGRPRTSLTRHQQHEKTKVTASRLGYQHLFFNCILTCFLVVFHLIYFFTFLTFLTVLLCFPLFLLFRFLFFTFFYLLLSFREGVESVTECLCACFQKGVRKRV